MEIKPKSVYEVMRIYDNMNGVNLLHVSATFYGNLQESIIRRIYRVFHDFRAQLQEVIS
jgi:hypothetical protein